MRRGFTLIELLMGMVIVGLLAAIAVPRWSRARERSIVTAMRSDIRNLAVLEESYFYDFSVYTDNLTVLGTRGFVLSPGVQMQIPEATSAGWSVSVSHPTTLQECHLYVGGVAPVGTATEDGRIDCR
jgi:type IV pilus assembly protein PilA